jgi:hypothetical protein
MQQQKESVVAIALNARPALEPVLAQGTLEKAFPAGLEACTERVRFAKEDQSAPFDGGLAMKRGILAGAAAEHELHQFASEGTFTIDLGQLVERLCRGSGKVQRGDQEKCRGLRQVHYSRASLPSRSAMRTGSSQWVQAPPRPSARQKRLQSGQRRSPR